MHSARSKRKGSAEEACGESMDIELRPQIKAKDKGKPKQCRIFA